VPHEQRNAKRIFYLAEPMTGTGNRQVGNTRGGRQTSQFGAEHDQTKGYQIEPRQVGRGDAPIC
jgi:hypothetical protein